MTEFAFPQILRSKKTGLQYVVVRTYYSKHHKKDLVTLLRPDGHGGYLKRNIPPSDVSQEYEEDFSGQGS